jgi:hypothetical protein
VAAVDKKIFENSIARARLIHMAILVGSFTLILVIAAKTFDNGRELRKLVEDQQALQTVLNKADSVIEDLNSYLLADFKRRKDLKFEVKPTLAQLLVDTIDANKLANQIAERLVSDRRFDPDKLAPVNLPLTPLRQAFEAPPNLGLNFGYATLAPRELRDLTFTELIVFSRFTRLHPRDWVEPLTKVLQAPDKSLPDEATKFAKLLEQSPSRPTDIDRNDPPGSLYEALLEREQTSRLQAGTRDSTYAETLAAATQGRAQIKTTLENRAGYYTVSIPEVGVDATAGFLAVAAPWVLLAALLAVLFALARAGLSLVAMTNNEFQELAMDWSYEPCLSGVAEGWRGQAVTFCVDLIQWSGFSLFLLVYLRWLFGGGQISNLVIVGVFVAVVFVHVAAFCLGALIRTKK